MNEGNKYGGIILPSLPPNADRYTRDMHKAVSNLLTAGKQSYEGYMEKVYFKTVGLADDGVFDTPKSGIFIIYESTGATFAIAEATAGDVVTIVNEKSAGDWDTADTDNKYCLIDQTTYIRLKNRKGSAKKFYVLIIGGQ